jgi:transcription antitermination protein NusB
LSKPSTAPASRAVIRDLKLASPPSKWPIFRESSPAENLLPRPRNLPHPESHGATKMSLRSKSREFAMQMLFQWDMSQQDPIRLEAKFWRAAKAAGTTREFANRLFEGAAKEVAVLDEIIVKHAENWRFERLAAIDRAILRLAMHELRCSDTPPKVVLNEAVDLAKKFSGDDSGAFVNGILDAFRKSLIQQ